MLAPGPSHILVCRQLKADSLSLLVDCPVEILPDALDLDPGEKPLNMPSPKLLGFVAFRVSELKSDFP
jgi:hypothetical protein